MATGGKAEEQELARLKGEKEAIEKVSLIKNCGITFAEPVRTAAKKPSKVSIDNGFPRT
jgi:hypothetical protein